MSDYARQHDFSIKDALTTGDPAKVIKGSEVDDEFDALVTAVASKTDDNSAVITGGSINNTTIGASTPAPGTFTDLEATVSAVLASLGLASGATVTSILDEDDMASDSATALATQQSIKAYIDTNLTVEVFKSAVESQSWGTGTAAVALTSQAHGLSGTPQEIITYVKCTDAAGDAGYAQNDIVYLSPWGAYAVAGSSLYNPQMWADSTNIDGIIPPNSGSTPVLLAHKTTGASTAITSAKWEMYFIAKYYT